ncbi:hypothetical protein F2Q68_00019143 [Brassica cretica]|uniref:Uncharacterized protein n=1 Tax=Brassica cretica TaxID=69181 RepID=A0A8S9FVT8_BRACR|nr:hypothetical protein F2Q68_00019143 [Brassica cretica]
MFVRGSSELAFLSFTDLCLNYQAQSISKCRYSRLDNPALRCFSAEVACLSHRTVLRRILTELGKPILWLQSKRPLPPQLYNLTSLRICGAEFNSGINLDLVAWWGLDTKKTVQGMRKKQKSCVSSPAEKKREDGEEERRREKEVKERKKRKKNLFG